MKRSTQPQPTAATPARATPSPASHKQDIDAALKALTQFIQKDPKKAAKIFESWIDESAHQRKNTPGKKAA